MNWITSITSKIDEAFAVVRKPLQTLPPLLLLCELATRPGLSAIALTAAIIKRLPEVGISIEPNPDGSPNYTSKMWTVAIDEIVKEFKDHGVVENVLQPGGVASVGTGVTAGGAPVVVNSVSTLPVTIKGILK